jgi:hypothetical protein
MKRYLVIDTHADEYSMNECSGTMTVGKLIEYLQTFDANTPIMIGNNKQGGEPDWWWTYGNITRTRIYDVEQKEEPKEVSLDNGRTFFDAEETIDAIENGDWGVNWETLVNFMDNDAREQVHSESAPCSNLEFLTKYLEIAPCDLIVG